MNETDVPGLLRAIADEGCDCRGGEAGTHTCLGGRAEVAVMEVLELRDRLKQAGEIFGRYIEIRDQMDELRALSTPIFITEPTP